MHHLVLIALIAFAVAIVLGLAVVGIQGLSAWRAFRSFKRKTGELLDDTASKIAGIEVRTANASRRAAELDRARAQLQGSLAQARVLSQGAGEVAAAFRRVRGFMPSK